jgi:hypothetical protein
MILYCYGESAIKKKEYIKQRTRNIHVLFRIWNRRTIAFRSYEMVVEKRTLGYGYSFFLDEMLIKAKIPLTLVMAKA